MGAVLPQSPAFAPPRRGKGLLRVGLMLLALYALYLVAANVFLNTGIGVSTINRKPERFGAQWRWAMSLYPGHIRAHDVSLHGRGGSLSWQVASNVAEGRIQLLPLLHRNLHFGPIRAGKVQLDVATGLKPLPPTPRKPGARPPWTLVFDRIHSDEVQRLRFADWQAEGQGSATFVFNKQLGGGQMQIPPSQLRMKGVTLTREKIAWARNADVALDFSMAGFVPAKVPGLENKIRLIKAHATVSGDAPGLRLVEDAAGSLHLHRDGEGGRVEANLGLADGALTVGSKLHARMPLELHLPHQPPRRYRVEGPLEALTDALAVTAQVPATANGDDFIDARLRLPGRALHPGQLHARLDQAQGRVRLQWRFPDVAWVNPLLSHGWLKLAGPAQIQADLQVRDGRIASGSSAEIPAANLTASVQGNLLAGQARAQARFTDGRASVALEADRFSVAPLKTPAQPYVQGADLTLRLDSSSALATFRDQLQARLTFRSADVPDLRNYNRMLPAGSVRLLAGNGTLDGDLRLDARGKPQQAQIALAGKGASVQLGDARITGDLRLDSRLRHVSGDAYVMDMLRLQLSGVELASAPQDGPWWANADLDGARFTWRQPMQLDGDASVQMKDVGLLLALFAERKALPGWVDKVVGGGEVQATSGVRVDGRSVVLDELRASNPRIALRARLRLADDTATGNLYVHWGILGLGVSLRQGERKLHLIDAKRWYDDSQPF